MNERMLVRFTRGERLFHWINFITFAVLAVTGAFLYVPWRPYAAGEAGETSRLLHRLAAIAFMATPIFTMILSRGKGFLGDLREAFTWRGEDFRAIGVLITRTYWTADARGLPPQGKFTAGQKLHIVLQNVAFLSAAVTGVILWFGAGRFPVGVFRWSLILHGGAAVVMTCFVVIHIYMTTLMPMTNQAIAAMILGTVSEGYARRHHPKWYERLRGRPPGPHAAG